MFGDGVSKEVTEVNEVIRVGPLSSKIGVRGQRRLRQRQWTVDRMDRDTWTETLQDFLSPGRAT